MAFLLDVNVLVALSWPPHEAHAAAQKWFQKHRAEGWASCPITQSGLLRMLANPAVTGGLAGMEAAQLILRTAVQQPEHRFVADNLPLAAGPELPRQHGARSPGQASDIRNGAPLPGSDSGEGARSKWREAAAGDGEGAYMDVRDRAGYGENEAPRRLSPRHAPLAAALDAIPVVLHGHRQVTDAYLVALAMAHQLRLATLDQGLIAWLPRSGPVRAAVELIG